MYPVSHVHFRDLHKPANLVPVHCLLYKHDWLIVIFPKKKKSKYLDTYKKCLLENFSSYKSIKDVEFDRNC